MEKWILRRSFEYKYIFNTGYFIKITLIYRFQAALKFVVDRTVQRSQMNNRIGQIQMALIGKKNTLLYFNNFFRSECSSRTRFVGGSVCLYVWCLYVWCLYVWCLYVWCLYVWCLYVWYLYVWCLYVWCLYVWCLYVWCLYVWCLYVCNILTPLPFSPLPSPTLFFYIRLPLFPPVE